MPAIVVATTAITQITRKLKWMPGRLDAGSETRKWMPSPPPASAWKADPK